MHSEFLLLYILGFSIYEYLLKRYCDWCENRYFLRGIIALLSISLLTIKYFSLIVLLGNIILLFVWFLLESIVNKIIIDEKLLIEKFAIKTTLISILFIILNIISTNIIPNDYFNTIWNKFIDKHVGNSLKILIYAIGYIFIIDGGTIIVKGMLKKFPALTQRAMDAISRSKKDSKSKNRPSIVRTEQENSGEIIGIIERILILTFVFVGSYEAVAFSVAAKSIARFNELDDKYFAEYYLLGTSMSVGIAVLVGVLIKQLI